MKDGITLHPEHGLNPSIEVCMICGEEMGIALLGNNIKGQAPHHICTGGVCDDYKKIIDDGGCFIIEVEDGSDQKNPYRTGRYCAIKKEAAKKMQQQRCLYRKVRSIYSKTFTRQRPTNYIIMSWINSDGRGVIRNISQKQNYARC